MKVKFANGTVKECSAPIEQKIFKTVNGETVNVGWLLMIKLTGEITSAALDGILTVENIASLEFFDDTSDEAIFTISGYNKLTTSTIRHSENVLTAYTEIQMSKGV